MSNHPTIKLSHERLTQLKEMAANIGAVNMSEVLAKLIEFAQNEGLVAHEIPGVKINVLADGLVIKFDDGEYVKFSISEAAIFASEIRTFLSGEPKTVISINADKQMNFGLKGRGQGIAISIPAKSPAKVLDRGLASEFARLIDMALPKVA